MSDLRFFADHMHGSIASDRRIAALESRLAEIEGNARRYSVECERLRDQMGPRSHRGRMSPDYHKATEGLCATRIILEGANV